jgi:hypothetical protein
VAALSLKQFLKALILFRQGNPQMLLHAPMHTFVAADAVIKDHAGDDCLKYQCKYNFPYMFLKMQSI